MKGIILAGGKGTRLYPTTRATCKQLLPIYDKPMIYYPLSILMMAGIREILLISTPEDQSRFYDLFRDGSHLGISIKYATQQEPRGIAEAFLIGASFIGNDPVALILGDNIFYGHDLVPFLQTARDKFEGGIIFGYEVQDPNRYGVIEFNDRGEVINIIEKPKIPPSNYAVTGLYFYDHRVVEIAKQLKPSPRGELEITDINVAYLRKNALKCHLFERGFAWLDTGTPDAMQSAADYVQTIQKRQGIKISCIEEVAWKMGYIDENQLKTLAQEHSASEYGHYLYKLLNKRAYDFAVI